MTDSLLNKPSRMCMPPCASSNSPKDFPVTSLPSSNLIIYLLILMRRAVRCREADLGFVIWTGNNNGTFVKESNWFRNLFRYTGGHRASDSKPHHEILTPMNILPLSWFTSSVINLASYHSTTADAPWAAKFFDFQIFSGSSCAYTNLHTLDSTGGLNAIKFGSPFLDIDGLFDCLYSDS